MALEIEKILGSLDSMAKSAAGRISARQSLVEEVQKSLETYSTDWGRIEATLQRVGERTDIRLYHGARPVRQGNGLGATIEAPVPPAKATIIAVDGSQIMPDRHASHLYSLINIGGLVYYHGDGRAPEPFTIPELEYPEEDWEAADFTFRSGDVGIRRDLKEIGSLADFAWQHRQSEDTLLALIDQRLLYWPLASPDDQVDANVQEWLAAMVKLRDSGAALAGYIDRPMTSAVVTFLLALAGLDSPDFDWKALGSAESRRGLTDAALFSRILRPGQRSIVFAGVSRRNKLFTEYDPAAEVCFFYFNPGPSGRKIARVDIPMWVAEEETAVAEVHALICDQCRILGDYPYVIARADEMAVIGRQDQEELNFMIDLTMQRYGIEGQVTGKQGSKGLARGGKTRHRGL